MPFGKVTATYKIGSEVHEATGTGYHDHDWMSTEMGHMLDHWWWTRGDVGATPSSWQPGGGEEVRPGAVQLYMLARDGKVIADDGARVTFTTSGSEVDQHTGKPFPEAICFDYRDGDTRYGSPSPARRRW